MGRIRPLVKYHGGKGRLYQWIIARLPPHRCYLEPFGGAASVLLNKPVAPKEVYNELEPLMYNLMRVVRDRFADLMAEVNRIDYSEENFQYHRSRLSTLSDPLARAVSFYVVKRMSRAGLCQRFSWSSRVYSRGPSEVHCWDTAREQLIAVHRRLQNVELLNADAFEILPEYLCQDDFVVYLDPPYLTSTRVYKDAYDIELGYDDHRRLATMLEGARARIALSGYYSDTYADWFTGWQLHVKDVANHSSQHTGKAKTRKQECLWTNYILPTSS